MSEPTVEIAAIRNILAAYNMAGDRSKVADLAGTFTEHAVLEMPTGVFRGRAEIMKAVCCGRCSESFPSAGPRPALLRHDITTCSVELTGPISATARTYFLVMTEIGLDHAGVYVDHLCRTKAGGWLISRRKMQIDWMSERSLFRHLREPQQQQAALVPELA